MVSNPYILALLKQHGWPQLSQALGLAPPTVVPPNVPLTGAEQAVMFPGGTVPGSYASPAWNSAGTLPAGAAALGGAGAVAGAALAPGLNTKQRAHTAARGVTDAALSYAIPYYGWAKAVNAIGQNLQRSGSPQVRSAGVALDYVTEPSGAKRFWDLTKGKNPFAGGAGAVARDLTLDGMGPIGVLMRATPLGEALGMFHTPTEGTTFRRSMEKGFRQIPGFETFEGGSSRNYDMTPEELAKFSQKDREAAEILAKAVAPLGAYHDNKGDAYTDQVRNMLLNMYGHPDELASKLGPALAFLNG